MSLLNCCSPIIYQSKDCGFCRLIESYLLSGNEVELTNVKANNVDCCECPQNRDLLKCKENKKEIKKIKKRQQKPSWWMIWKYIP